MLHFPNAKINIGLNIVERRPDGYHNIETVFYPIGISDRLELKRNEDIEDFRLYTNGIDVNAEPEKNLLIKAYRLLQQEYGISGIDIRFTKNIPFGAGLGGGSADAAYMLKALNDEFELNIPKEKLQELAARIGADCPFFIANEPTFAEGIGDQFSPISIKLNGYYLLLVKPDVHVSTPVAYAKVKPQKPARNLKDIIENEPIEHWKNLVQNDFEHSVFAQFPELGKIKNQLYETGATYAAMSGSGSTLFGIYKTKPNTDCFERHFTYTEELIL